VRSEITSCDIKSCAETEIFCRIRRHEVEHPAFLNPTAVEVSHVKMQYGNF
jgi:hypothetical protein